MMASGVTSADVTDFDHGLKRDPKSYIEFHGQTSKYFRVRRQWLSTARVDRVDRIFDLNFVIPTMGTMDYSLFERQCAYVMSVFNTVIKAGQARTIVQRHSITGNAHDVVLDLHSHYASAGNLTLLQTEFQMELSTMRLTSKYTGGPCKFLQNFQEKYQDLEDTRQSIVPDHEKIGQLRACVRDYTAFASIVNDMTRTAKQLKSSLSFADIMVELTTKAKET